MITLFEKYLSVDEITKYRVGDFVICNIPDPQYPGSIYGKIVDIELDRSSDEGAPPTVFVLVETESGEEISLWQSPNDGEIVDYWKDVDEEDFEMKLKARKYNI